MPALFLFQEPLVPFFLLLLLFVFAWLHYILIHMSELCILQVIKVFLSLQNVCWFWLETSSIPGKIALKSSNIEMKLVDLVGLGSSFLTLIYKSNICRDGNPLAYRLVGLVVKASASRAEGPGFESRLRRDFFGVKSYQWLKNWHSGGYPARRLAL